MQSLVYLAVGLFVGISLVMLGRRPVPAPPLAHGEGGLRSLGAREIAALERLLHRGPPRDPNQAIEEQMTFGQKVADRVAQFGGSWTFIGLFLAGMAVWMTVNAIERKPFDPYPFILLNLVLSCLAALQAPVIMMSQNRQSLKDRIMASHDYEVNVRAEVELQSLHLRFDELRERDWAALVVMQQRQIDLLEDIVRCLGPGRGGA
jgi:uncharacterized membrane protein